MRSPGSSPMNPAHAAAVIALALTACSPDPKSEHPNEIVPAEPKAAEPASEQPEVEAAVLTPVKMEGNISVPRVTGIGAEAASRINAVLDREREEAIQAREACLRTAEGRGSEYELKAEETYNADGLLSLRMTGYAFCGGANGTTLYGSHNFDLRTGETIDIAAATATEPEILVQMALPHYSGPEECKTAIEQGDALATLGAAYIDSEGLGVVYSLTPGAAESCGAYPAIIPAAEVRTKMQIEAPLKRAWSGGEYGGTGGPGTARAVYRCEDGTRLQFRFDGDAGAAFLKLPDGSESRLEQQAVASGFHYRNAKYDLRGKGSEATFAIGETPRVKCMAEE